MVQVHLDACLPDVRVAPVKMIGTAAQRSSAEGDDRGAVYKKTYARSRSARGSAGEEDVYEAEFGGPAERRASSRSKSRTAKEARAELLGLEEVERNAARLREVRSRSAVRVREGVDIEMDAGAEEVSKSRSSSRTRGRAPKAKNNEAVVEAGARAAKTGTDALEVLYTGRSTPRARTPRSSVRLSREQDDSKAPPEDPDDEREKVSYRYPTRGPGLSSDLPEERRPTRRSPRKATVEATDMLVEQPEGAPRRNVRKADLDGPDDEEDGTGLHRRGRVLRQPKRKVRDIPRDLPVSHPPEAEMVDAAPLEHADPPLMPSSPTTSSRSSRGTGNSRIAWLHVLGDLIMWRDVPRSALWFGAGSFSILSTSFMQEMQLGIVAISANLALCYLAVVFFYRTFLRGLPAESTVEMEAGRVTEADFLGWIRFALPAINLALKKAREVFSGDPATTLRVAIVLWLVAKMGAGISIWSFLRFGFFALFTIPKCHSNYSNQIYAFGQSLLLRAWMSWDSFTHKKAMLIGGFLLAWNISSYSSRLWGGFILVVWLKLYQQSNPASFDKALADASGSSAIDRIDRRKSLQHATTASQLSQATPMAEETPSPQIQPVKVLPDRTMNGVTYRG